MKSISKAMIAVMMAAAMCIVPLFVIEDSAATEIKTGDVGVSFKAGEISKENYEKLMPVESYGAFAESALTALGLDSDDFEITGIKVTKIKDVKLSLGNKVTDSKGYQTSSQAATAEIEFVATCDPSWGTGCDLFAMVDGTQNLYKEIGTNKVVEGNTLTFKGTVVMEEMSSSISTIEKTYGENVIPTAGEGKSSNYVSYKGDMTFKNATGEYKIAVDAESGSSYDSEIEYDFYDVKVADLKADSKVIMTTKQTGAMKTAISYDYKDKKSSYESYTDAARLGANGIYMQFVVGDIIAPATVECKPYVYYDPDAVLNPFTGDITTVGLFNNLTVQDDSLKDNDKMKTFLKDIGTVGDSYSDAESVANGAYENVEESSSSGGSNIIFYVIIGVLAVAVVALAVLMIKKK